MQEIEANLWEVPADLRMITTNPIVRKKDGACVMGRGCALEAKTRYPGIEYRLGELLKAYGNRVMRIGRYDDVVIASFPVKRHWREEAVPELIRRSARQLVELADKFGYRNVVLPRPGCGNGKLSWSEIRPLLAEVLDERFTVLTFPKKGGHARRKGSGTFRIEVRSYVSPDDLGRGALMFSRE